MNKVMKIAIITPYCKESVDQIKECHLSVISQKVDADITHFLIADGFPLDEINSWDAKHIILSDCHNDFGNTPRGIGGLLADTEGYDFISYLDADNWFHENHLNSMLEEWVKNKNPIICCFRSFHKVNGEELLINESDENALMHVDTSCFLINRISFDILDIWLKTPKKLCGICDRVFYAAIKWKEYKISFTKKRSVAYRTRYKIHYKNQDTSNLDLKSTDEIRKSFEYLITSEGISDCINSIKFWPKTYL